ncbi:hypothetical protein [Williamwhitmania taraxaci]|uniref:Uncharacterized protein n=1 Tax=Williamwhitmania taraxaci TaxID=1640674 RepID=A0A1G6KRH4_9BACT|nr:hypothetical protein [Williamwhitmania taraxaci]SDC33574.1 hypothetical protein SAMN05216323_102636 [Williamwhitmania taraxaci]
MAFRGLIKLPSHKQFGYVPRYYDKEKEEKEEQRKKRALELGIEDRNSDHKPGTNIRLGAMRGHYRQKETGKRTSTIRVVIIIFLLLLVAYYLLS